MASPDKSARLAPKRLAWKQSVKLVATVFPPIDLFEEVADAEDIDALMALGARTDPLISERIHPALTAESFGVYYAARDEATAIAEVKHHRVAFLEAMRAPAQDLDFEVLRAPVKGGHFYDLRGRQREIPDVYSPTDYSASQKLGVELRRRDADGIAYDSVRREGGECVAVFRPRCVGPARPVKHLIFRWDGAAITAVLETHRLA